MNFFEHQDRARRQSYWLIVLFALAVIAIVVAINAVVLLVFGLAEAQDTAARQPGPGLSLDLIRENADLVLWTSLLVGGGILLASLFRSQTLKSGGGAVARELGGTLVEPDTADPLRRRLRNVVEEVAIASGVPVPEVYVLENESGINAFAAGYSTSDAAVAVTRGTLETLNREELQGVIAHEFSHILHGDMRLNIRLIGILFGILVLSVIGSRLLLSMRFAGRSRNAGGIIALGLAVMLIGYIGLFFGRWIQAAVSRRREYLADASAVQFTRNPDGIAGALKKIGAAQSGSTLKANAQEVGHMLFARGFATRMFSTHPPLVDRIRAIEPGFDLEELKAVRAQMTRHGEARRAAQEEAEQPGRSQPRGPGGLRLDPDSLIDQIGQPGLGQILAAGILTATLPRPLIQAAHSSEWAPEVICYLLMETDPDIRDRQLQLINRHLGPESETQVRALLKAAPELSAEQRLPLLEIAFPALRRRPDAEIETLMALIDGLIEVDSKIKVFDYVLARLLRIQLDEARHPADARTGGNTRLAACRNEIRDLLAVLAYHGTSESTQAEGAFNAGLAALDMETQTPPDIGSDWPARLDQALDRLDSLAMPDKRQLIRSLGATITHGGETIPAEVELLRVICARLHVPMPALDTAESGNK